MTENGPKQVCNNHNSQDRGTMSAGNVSDSTTTALFFLPSCWQSALAQVTTWTVFAHLLLKQSSHGIFFTKQHGHSTQRANLTGSTEAKRIWQTEEDSAAGELALGVLQKRAFSLDLHDAGQPASLTDRYPHLWNGYKVSQCVWITVKLIVWSEYNSPVIYYESVFHYINLLRCLQTFI